MKWLLSFSLCFCMHICAAQNYADSALNLYTQFDWGELSENDQTLLDSCREYFQPESLDTSILHGLLEIVSFSVDEKLGEDFNRLLGNATLHLLEDAKDEEAIILKQYLAGHYLNQASFLAIKNQLRAALELRYKALEISTQNKDTTYMILCMIKLGVDHFNAADLEQSEKWYRQAIGLMELTGDSISIKRIQESIGSILSKKGNYEEATPYFYESLELALTENNYPQQAQIFSALGNNYMKLKQYDLAEENLKNALEIFERFGFAYGVSLVNDQLASLALLQKQWAKAKKYASKAFEIASNLNIPHAKSSASHVLARVYKQEGNFEKSLEMFELYTQLKDSLGGEANTRELLEQRYQFEYTQQAALDSIRNAATLAVQVEENKRRKTLANFLWGVLGLTLIFGFILLNRFRVTRNQKAIIEEEKLKLDKANEQLKELDKEKSRFFTNISHEFRTPMTVISGMATKMKEKPEKWQDRGLDIITRNSNHVLSLINQILDLRKLEAGSLELNLIQADIVPYLRYLSESLHSFAEQKGVELEFEPKVESILMDYDASKLQAIVTNLLSNAVKFTPAGGIVRLNADRVWNPVSVKPNDQEMLTILITDTGIGIPEEKLPYIFDRFYQVDDSSTREGEGTGIGLALVRELVRLMGGTIEVTSQLGKGSTFTINLPITTQAHLESQIQTDEPNISIPPISTAPQIVIPKLQQNLPHLLIVEDNEDVVQYLSACLEDEYNLQIARNGQEGIDMAIKAVPDIIISDVMMPLKDGFEVCQTLKEDERTSHIPIILLTAKADVESRISGLKRGADAYLAKPFNPEELQVRLDMLVRLRKSLQQRYAKPLDQIEPSEEVAVQQEDAFIQKLRNTILEHLDDTDLNVTKLCDLEKMSRTQLHNKVKALTGRSATSFVRYVRLLEAQKLLKNSDLHISEIAYEVGFNNPSYFTRVFTEEYGFAPSDARK